MTPIETSAPQKVLTYRTIWISDFHLGTHGCQSELLLDFLKNTESQFLYLVGDIVDGWRLKKRWYWPQSHNDIIQKILRRARHGAQVFYIPGNHDEAARDYCNLQFGGMFVTDSVIHTTVQNKRLYILHGDKFDTVMAYAKWLAKLGDAFYMMALNANAVLNYIRRKMGFRYWSLSAYLKHKVKQTVEYIGNYESFIVDEARRQKVDGVICGHIHYAECRTIGSIDYYNVGDWVESCTALVEEMDGTLRLINWPRDREQLLRS